MRISGGDKVRGCDIHCPKFSIGAMSIDLFIVGSDVRTNGDGKSKGPLTSSPSSSSFHKSVSQSSISPDTADILLKRNPSRGMG